jgi:opacity protein-like surface antigen
MKKFFTILAASLVAFSVQANGPLKELSKLSLKSNTQTTNYLSALSLDEPLELSSVDRRSRNCFKEGTMVASLGYGVPNLGRTLFKLTEQLYPESTVGGYGPIFAKFEYAVSNKIGLGAVIRIHGASLEYPVSGSAYDEDGNYSGDTTYTYTEKISSFAAMFRFNYHFATGKKIDPYVGLGLGYGSTKWTFESGDPDGIEPVFKSPIPLGSEFTIGMRYFFSDAIGAYAEVGLSKSIANFGLAIKI